MRLYDLLLNVFVTKYKIANRCKVCAWKKTNIYIILSILIFVDHSTTFKSLLTHSTLRILLWISFSVFYSIHADSQIMIKKTFFRQWIQARRTTAAHTIHLKHWMRAVQIHSVTTYYTDESSEPLNDSLCECKRPL